jgi:chloramphenicol 3-O phosphotransferase
VRDLAPGRAARRAPWWDDRLRHPAQRRLERREDDARLIVDHLIETAAWRAELTRLLSGVDVFAVGVHCDVAELERRERLRGDRWPGEARSHLEVDRVHDLGPSDLDVDTTRTDAGALADVVITAWRARGSQRALR